jgi:predicted membrane-bound mannosyltransferase
VDIVLFTSFFSNRAGLLDSVRTYLPRTHRVEGASPHIHSWGFYLHRLIFYHAVPGPFWSEGLILILALVGIVAVFRHKLPAGANANLIRFIALYTIVLTAIYCAIPYKTPWCLLNFWLGMILLGGVGAMTLIERASTRGRKLAFAVVLVIGAGQLAAEAWLTSVVRPTKPGNPYAYSQTSPDVLKLCAEVEAIAKASPQKHQTIIKVIAPESGYWPLPWYLRDFENVGFWAEVPHDPYAPMMIVSAKFDANLDADKRHVMAGLFQLRPDAFFELYVSTNLWDDYLKTRPPEP